MLDKFINKDGIIFYKGFVLGSFMDCFGHKTFTQFSNDGQLFDIELSKKFMKTETNKPLIVIRGHSTKTQQWFKIKEEKT